MGSMFYQCDSLVALDLSSWDASNVADANDMFMDCRSLETLDLSGWSSDQMDASHMFDGCDSLESPRVPEGSPIETEWRDWESARRDVIAGDER